MRISDWSSDVCSSDLTHRIIALAGRVGERAGAAIHVGGSNQSRLREIGPGRVVIGLRAIEREARRRVRPTAFDHERHRALDLVRREIGLARPLPARHVRSEEHTSELQSLMRISYAVFCLQQKKNMTTRISNRNLVRYEY